MFGVTEPDRVDRLRSALLALIDTFPFFLLPEPAMRDFGRLSPGGRLRRRLETADALLYAEIERRRGEPDLDQRIDVLSLLLRARDEDGQAMTDPELRDELITMLAAGHETTATGLALPSTCCCVTHGLPTAYARSSPPATTPISTRWSPRRSGCAR